MEEKWYNSYFGGGLGFGLGALGLLVGMGSCMKSCCEGEYITNDKRYVEQIQEQTKQQNQLTKHNQNIKYLKD